MATLEAHSTGLAGDPEIVRRLRADEPAAIEELHGFLRGGPRALAARILGAPAAESWCLDVQPAVVRAVKAGDIRDSGELVAFVQGRVAALRKNRAPVEVPRREEEESSCADTRAVRVMIDVLRRLPPRDREAVARFYVSGHPEESICLEAELSVSEFRTLRANIRLISRLCGSPSRMRPQRGRGVTPDCSSPATSEHPPLP